MIVHMFDEALVGVYRDLLHLEVGARDATELGAVVRNIARIRASLDAVEVRVANRAEDLNADGKCEPASSMLARNGRTSQKAGRRTAARAKAAAQAPAVQDALAAGEITGEHADVLANAAARLTDEQRAKLYADQTGLAKAAARMSPERFADHLRGIITAIETDEGAARADEQRRQTRLKKYVDPRTGMYHLAATLDPVLGAIVFKALDDQTRAMIYAKNDADLGDVVPTLRTDWEHVAAHALGALLRGGKAKTSGVEADVIIVIDAHTIINGAHEHTHCATTDNIEIPVASARRLLCTAVQHLAITDINGQVLDLGTSTARPNRAQRRALQAMYSTCAWDGCDTALSRCEIHHVTFRRFGGPTDLDNLLPLCVKHHHMVHEGRWRIELTPERTIRIWRPDGEHLIDSPLQPNVTTKQAAHAA